MKKILLFFAILYFFACQSTEKTPTPKAQPPSTIEMATLLADIAKSATPSHNYQLNTQRAAALKPQYDQATTPSAKITAGFKYLQELLSAGQNELVVQELVNMMNLVGGYENALSERTKPLYDMMALGYMRQGEQANCIVNHTSASCIVPFQPEGYHKITTGSENAIAVYTRILTMFPDDYQSRWMINIAYMTLGKYPNAVPEAWRIPLTAFQKTNTTLTDFKDVAVGLGVDVKGLSGGCNIEDFNNDGLLDIFATSYGMGDQVRLFLNKGDGSFEEVTESALLTGITGGLNTNHVDYDNDGDQDILILRGGWWDMGGKQPNSLLRNNGDGTFEDVTKAAGLLSFHPTQTAAWADFNNDGWLDLFIGNETKTEHHPCEFYINNGDGTFRNAAAQYGLNREGFIKGVAWGDINNDGFPELYVSVLEGKNWLLLNHKGNSFEDIGDKAGVTGPFASFPTWFWDYNNDGFQDLFVAGYDTRRLHMVSFDASLEAYGLPAVAERPKLYKNNGDATFTDVTAQVGLDKVMYAMGCNFGDLDNDGFLDFYIGTGAPDFRSIVPNRMFKNVKGERFEEVTMNGFGHIQKGHGVAFGDLDNDGDQDIYCTMGGAFEADLAQNILFENKNNSNNWLTIELEGKTVNRNALGSVIAVTVLGEDNQTRTIYQTVGTGASFGASSIQQEIGLGKVEKIEQVEVRWTNQSAAPAIFKDIKLNTFLKIKEGSTAVEYLKKKTLKMKKNSEEKHHNH